MTHPCCLDRNGKPKKKYKHQEEAEKISQRRRDEGVGINVYLCQHRDGWHLTSQNAVTPVRPANVMSHEDRRLYSGPGKNRLGEIIGDEMLIQLRTETGRSMLESLERKVGAIQQAIDAKLEVLRVRKSEIAILVAEQRRTEQGLREARQELSAAKNEFELARRSIERNSR